MKSYKEYSKIEIIKKAIKDLEKKGYCKKCANQLVAPLGPWIEICPKCKKIFEGETNGKSKKTKD